MSSTQDMSPRWSTTVADPAALGLAGFAMTTFVLSLANTGLIAGAGAAVLGLALFYGGIAQLLAGMWEFVKGNTFGAVAFSSYGAFWLSFWFLLTTGGDKAAGSAGVGAYLLAWTIFTAAASRMRLPDDLFTSTCSTLPSLRIDTVSTRLP